MYTQMKFTDKDKCFDFSELVNGKEMFVTSYKVPYNSTILTIVFTEKEMRELRKHLTIQIRKIKKSIS